ncbi:MAG: CpsD/CapB family tyrosine-protein kinase [Burkholderiales bacterium]
MSTSTASQNSRDSQQASHESAGQDSRSRCEITAIERLAEPDERLIIAHDPHDPRCEKIRALRTELLLRRESLDRADVVALLSPCPGEGRSQLAAELAIAFAQTGRPTLLVDADLRRPQQHLLFGTDNRQGLSQALESGVKPRLHAVQGLPRMAVLTAGPVPGNPLELLSSRAFSSMVEDWRDNFEFVVIDTAPVMQFSDALAVANVVGRVLTLSRAQHTSYKDMQDMLRRLAATRSQVLGAVISHF